MRAVQHRLFSVHLTAAHKHRILSNINLGVLRRVDRYKKGRRAASVPLYKQSDIRMLRALLQASLRHGHYFVTQFLLCSPLLEQHIAFAWCVMFVRVCVCVNVYMRVSESWGKRLRECAKKRCQRVCRILNKQLP
jgi:hypothetical protein